MEFVTLNVDRIFGYSDVDFFSGRVLYSKVVHPEDIQRDAQEVATYSQEPGRTAFVHEPYRIVALDGTVHWVNDQTFIRRDHTGSITHFQGIVENITDKHLPADQLAAEKERLGVTVRSIGNLSLAKLDVQPGNYIQLSIQDEGIGTHPKHLKNIVDPYSPPNKKAAGWAWPWPTASSPDTTDN